MSFVDKATITIKAGNGGNGSVSFRREKFVDRGGPDGGDGGHGGSVIFLASRNENTLSLFRHQKSLAAEAGENGSKRRMHGKNGTDLIIKVPIGTVLLNESNKVLADLVADDQRAIIAEGGRGGFGNAHFVSSTRQAPKFAEKGEILEEHKITLELKMIADVGLVGLPNAGKSTLLASLSNARPEIADYPFTTLTPNLGVFDLDKETSILIADIPGLIEGASNGRGLGIEFLKHIERTLVLVHMIDVYGEDVAADYQVIQNELKAYQIDLTKRPELVVLNKIDGYDKNELSQKLESLKQVVPKKNKILAISAFSKEGLKEFNIELKKMVTKERQKMQRAADRKEKTSIPILRLPNNELSWKITKSRDGYNVIGHRIEKFASRSDFTNQQSVQRLRDIMKKMGIMHELVRMGIMPGNAIHIGNYGTIEF